MAITRRDFLKSSAAAAAALTVPHPIFRGMAHAAGPAGAIVVILQMEGGNDGLEGERSQLDGLAVHRRTLQWLQP